MLKRRGPRVAVSGFLLAVAVAGPTACRTSPSVAAYVGDAQVSVSELRSAIDERTADEQVAAVAEANEAEYTRRVLALLVQGEVHTVAAERYGVEVTDAEVRSRIDTLLGDDDPETVFGQLAQQGIARADVVETVRQQLVRREIAAAQGEVEEPSEAELRARYDQVRQELAEVSFGYINVPDQAAADAVSASLQSDPGQYAPLAAQYPGPYTQPELDQRPLGEVPGPLAEPLAAAQPGTAFTVSVPEVEGVLVGYLQDTVYPPFEEVRPQLEQEFTQAAEAAGTALVGEVRQDLDVVVNPRYGELADTGELVPGGSGVVRLLDDPAQGSAAAPGE